MNNWNQQAHEMLITHGFTQGGTKATQFWYAKGHHEIRFPESRIVHLYNQKKEILVSHIYEKELRVLENVIFYNGLNEPFVERLLSKHKEIYSFKDKYEPIMISVNQVEF